MIIWTNHIVCQSINPWLCHCSQAHNSDLVNENWKY